MLSVVGSPLIDSFLGTLQTISGQYASEMERVISKHDCHFYDNEQKICKRKRRQLERLFRNTRSTIDKLPMQNATEKYYELFHKKRSRFFWRRNLMKLICRSCNSQLLKSSLDLKKSKLYLRSSLVGN